MREFQSRASQGNVSNSPMRRRKGFTLFEIVAVMSIMSLMMWFTIPALQSVDGAKNLTANAIAIQQILSQARAQAMLRNSYVYVGFYESDASQPDTLRPAPGGTGRLWVGVAASKDGTQGYDMTNSAAWNATNLTPVDKLHYFDNLHLTTNASFYSSNMPVNTLSPAGDPSATNTPFGWPVENSNSITQFSTGVIQFTPQGTAMLPGSSTAPEYLQIALIPTHGKLLPTTSSNAAVIQVDAITGSVTTYRP
jgi:prepilin-type N-terminal cleavage/methylation domain-containing protein